MNGEPGYEGPLVAPAVEHYSYAKRSKDFGKLEEKEKKRDLRDRYALGGKIYGDYNPQGSVCQRRAPIP